MNTVSRCRLRGALLFALLCAPGIAEATSLVSYLHVATSGNISGPSDQYTRLDHPRINDDPDARLLVTQNWNPPGSAGVYNDHPIGVVFFANFSGGGHWYIVNEDSGPILVGAAFNVLILGPGSLSFVHHTTDANSTGRATVLNPIDPGCLLCPGGVRLLYTHTFTAFGMPGSSFDYHSSVIYSSPSYAIITESRNPGFIEPMPHGVFFNVVVADSPGVASSPGWAFQHVASAGTNQSNWTLLSHSQLTGRPNALVFVARAGPASADSPNELGVWYADYASTWSVFFQNTGASMVTDSLYNVYIPPLMSDGFEGGDLSWWSSAVGAVP